jgi:hypothetical protein
LATKAIAIAVISIFMVIAPFKSLCLHLPIWLIAAYSILRDLAVQLTGHDYLRSLGVELVPTSAPDFFTTDTPTAVLVRQVLGAAGKAFTVMRL